MSERVEGELLNFFSLTPQMESAREREKNGERRSSFSRKTFSTDTHTKKKNSRQSKKKPLIKMERQH